MKCPKCGKEFEVDDISGDIDDNEVSALIWCSGCGAEYNIGLATYDDFNS